MYAAALQSEQFPQPLSLGAAHRNFSLFLIIHTQLIRTLEPGNNFFDSINIYQVGTMRSPKKIGIQTVEQFFQGTAVGLAFHASRTSSHHADHTVFDGSEANIFLID